MISYVANVVVVVKQKKNDIGKEVIYMVQKNTQKIYENTTQTQYKQTQIDSLRLRTRVAPQKIYFDRPYNTRKKHTHGLDALDKSKQLTTFNMRKLGVKDTPTEYIEFEGQMIKLKKFLVMLKRQHNQYILNSKSFALIVKANNTISTYEILTLNHKQVEKRLANK